VGLGWAALADLDQCGVALEAEGAAAFGGDLLWGPGGSVGEGDGGVADGLEAGQAVDDLGLEPGFGVVGGVGEGDGYFDEVFLGDAGDVGAGGFEVWSDGDGAEEAEVDYVAGEGGVVAVAEGGADFGLGCCVGCRHVGTTPSPLCLVQSIQSKRLIF
jgi:hypothetical protein